MPQTAVRMVTAPSSPITVRADEGRWEDFLPGVQTKHLWNDGTAESMLVRMQPGARRVGEPFDRKLQVSAATRLELHHEAVPVHLDGLPAADDLAALVLAVGAGLHDDRSRRGLG